MWNYNLSKVAGVITKLQRCVITHKALSYRVPNIALEVGCKDFALKIFIELRMLQYWVFNKIDSHWNFKILLNKIIKKVHLKVSCIQQSYNLLTFKWFQSVISIPKRKTQLFQVCIGASTVKGGAFLGVPLYDIFTMITSNVHWGTNNEVFSAS